MKNLGLLIFLLVSILNLGLSLAKIGPQSQVKAKINCTKTTLSENTSPNHSHFHYKYNSPFTGEEDENEDEIGGFEQLKASSFQYKPSFFDKNSLKNYHCIFDISDPYLNQVFSPPDFICS